MIINKMLIIGFISFILGIVFTILAFSTHAFFLSLSFVSFFVSGMLFWVSQLPDPLDNIPNGLEWELQKQDSVK